AHFRHSGKDVHSPGFYLHVDPGQCFIAGGVWMPDSKGLRMIRDAIADKPNEWKKVRKLVDSEDRLIRPPQGFDADHQYIEDIKLKSFTASVPLTDGQVTSPDFMKTFVGGCKTISPLLKFLATAVGQPW
ncbi:MAG: TIGR02453 family protein, partial [Acidimicrobiia bacterium]